MCWSGSGGEKQVAAGRRHLTLTADRRALTDAAESTASEPVHFFFFFFCPPPPVEGLCRKAPQQCLVLI